MGDKEDYLTSYRMFFEYFAETVDPEDQLPVQIAGYTITESELAGEVLHWITQYLSQKQCPASLLSPLRRLILEDVRIASKKHPLDFGYKPDQGVYEALRLMQAVTARANDICLRHLDNSRLDSLPAPPLKAKEIKTVSCAAKNTRRAMEDRHVEIPSLEDMFGIETTEPTSFYAVYDGHAGSAAAIYSAIHLHQYLVESPHFTTDLQRAMIDAFLRTDTEFVRKSNQELACGGSTAVAIAVRGNKLLAAWAGDSLALLAKRMRLLQLVCAHKPDRPDEKERIESSGGTVLFWGTWRVNGQLAVSRAIGDAQYKPYVTARPEVATVNLDGDEDFVVVACDGLWDFVSEDEVALTVYRQIANDQDDLNAVTKRLIAQAKRQGSTDNISIIVVFLKDPHAIAADNAPPMDLGLDNALANGPPFPTDNEACKRPLEAAAVVMDSCDNNLEDNDNGVDNSDSDSEDLGPETAVDADDVDADSRDHEANAVTPLAHIEEARHVEGATADNVAESGDDSDDEWNYFRGDREPDQSLDQSIEQSVDQSADQQDDQPHSETPCQDNSAWETSSVDMNSSPLNPDAPVFVPGGVSDKLLAESPRKPLPMDDIELPDVAQFETGAISRPAELLDLDNCDQLNGHHNISLDEAKEHLNGNMDSLGFGFGFGSEKDTALMQDFDRIQKDTTDFCNIQVFQNTTETNPFAAEGNDELFERLKNKERDPMSMSFYQEKDDDTCERLLKRESHVDLNAVQTLPDSDDEEIQTNGVHNIINESEKENICIDQNSEILGVQRIQEPNNDILRFDGAHDNSPDFGQSDNLSDFISNANNYSGNEFDPNSAVQEVAQTPESHKLMFEQIPEIPDGKSSELGFANEDNLDPSESEKHVRVITPQDDASHEVDLENKGEETLETDVQHKDANEDQDLIHTEESQPVLSPEPTVRNENDNEITVDPEIVENHSTLSPEPHIPSENCNIYEAVTPEQTHDNQDISVDVHQESAPEPFENESNFKEQFDEDEKEVVEPPEITLNEPEPELELVKEDELVAPSPVPSKSPLPQSASPVPEESQSPLLAPSQSPLPAQSQSPLLTQSQSPIPAQSPLPTESKIPVESPLPVRSPLPAEPEASPVASPVPIELKSPTPVAARSPTPINARSPTPQPEERPTSPIPAEIPLLRESPAPVEHLIPVNSPTPIVDAECEVTTEEAISPSPAPTESPLPTEPTFPAESPAPSVPELTMESAPAPDVVPETRSDLVTDIDIGISESHAQEICVPVTSEIVEAVDATPPPTPAAAVEDTPIAADVATAAVAAAAAVAATAAVAAKTATKKSSTAPKAPTARTSTSLSAATKPTTPATKPATPLSKQATPKPSTLAVKAPTPLTKTTPAKPTSALTKPAPKPTANPAPKPTAKPAPKPAVPRVAPVKKAPAVSKSSMTTLRAAKPPVTRSALTRPAATKPAAPTRPASAPKTTSAAPKTTSGAPKTTSAAPKPTSAAPKPTSAAPKPTLVPKAAPRTVPARPKPEPIKKPTEPAKAKPLEIKPKIERKPLSNGDVKTATKPAPRPAPRVPLAATTKSAAPRAALDKQGKDLANKRLTARAAPHRTAPAKTAAPPPGTKPAPIRKPADKKLAEPIKMESTQNGHSEPELKPPPSPTPADNALLPDVIA